MKIVVKVNSLEDIYQIEADSYLLTSRKFSLRFMHEFSLQEIRKAKEYCKKNNKELGVIVNKIMFDEELPDVEKYLNKLKEIDIDKIYFADLGVFMIAKKLNMVDKMVFFHETFIRNSYDVDSYKKMGIKHFVCSKDMNIASIKKMNDKDNLGIVCFGYMPIYYSKRTIVSNFAQLHNLKVDTNSFTLSLKEKTRDDVLYKVVEQNKQATIFNSEVLSYIDYMIELNQYIEYFIFDSIFFDSDAMNEIIAIHKKACNEKVTLSMPYTSLFLDKKVGLL